MVNNSLHLAYGNRLKRFLTFPPTTPTRVQVANEKSVCFEKFTSERRKLIALKFA